jgi:hypothetical protein
MDAKLPEEKFVRLITGSERMKNSTVIEHKIPFSKLERWCNQCHLHVNEADEIDISYYTAEFYLWYMATPINQRCKHQKPYPTQPNKAELKQMVEAQFQGFMWENDLKNILDAIIEKLPGD